MIGIVGRATRRERLLVCGGVRVNLPFTSTAVQPATNVVMTMEALVYPHQLSNTPNGNGSSDSDGMGNHTVNGEVGWVTLEAKLPAPISNAAHAVLNGTRFIISYA